MSDPQNEKLTPPAAIPPTSEADPSAKTEGGAVKWVASHQTAGVIVAFVLTLLYVSPLIVISVAAYQTQLFQEPNAGLSWFAAFMKTSDSTLNGVHKVLFPFLSTLSIVAFKDKINYSVIALGMFVLAMFMLSVYVGVLFDMDQMVTRLTSLSDKVNVATSKAFFAKIEDTLLMYLMVLLGVSAISESPKQKGTST